MIQYIRCHGNLELSFFSDFFRDSNSPLANLARSGRSISLSVRQSNDEFQISAVDLRSDRFNSEVVHISSLSSAETLWLCENMEQYKKKKQQ